MRAPLGDYLQEDTRGKATNFYYSPCNPFIENFIGGIKIFHRNRRMKL